MSRLIERNTIKALVSACEKFIFSEVLRSQEDAGSAVKRRLFQIGTVFSHVPSGTITNDPLVSGFHSSVSALFFPRFNLFGKKVEAQRTGRLVKVYILAFELIALHKQLVF